MTRILFCTLLALVTGPFHSNAEELIPGVLTFDPPSFLSDIPSGSPRTNYENGIRMIRRYTAADNDPRKSQRVLIISMREFKSALVSNKNGAAGSLDKQALRDAMLAAVNSTPHATNVTVVTKAEVGGQAAWLISYQLLRPYWQKPNGELFPVEVYWVEVQPNQVTEIKLIADSPEHLQTLKTCLTKFKIRKMDDLIAVESTGNAQ